ncbi:MAG: hypothetical protein LM589_01460 [Thermosphaera sp.]|nr:hypothetical protein [Thermosphaera sp.]
MYSYEAWIYGLRAWITIALVILVVSIVHVSMVNTEDFDSKVGGWLIGCLV